MGHNGSASWRGRSPALLDSPLGPLQTDANFAVFINEANSGLFKRFLYFKDRVSPAA
jgi:hypothetical protein